MDSAIFFLTATAEGGKIGAAGTAEGSWKREMGEGLNGVFGKGGTFVEVVGD